jgi:hypothetical protein
VVDELVHGHGEEVEEHHLGHRPVAGQSGADGGPEDRLLGDGRVPDAVGSVRRGQALGDLEHAAGRVGDVLAEQQHLRVGGQRQVEGGVHGHRRRHLGFFDEGHRPSTQDRSANTSS